jgi:putative transposase
MQLIAWLAKRQVPITRACAHLGLPRSSYYERPASKAIADTPVIDVLNQVVAQYVRRGFSLCFDWMRNQGYEWNHKRVWRIYKEMGLNLPRRTKKRIPKLPKVPLIARTEANLIWALDFMYDTLHYGRPFRTMNVIDEYNLKILATEIDISLRTARVVRTLEQLEEIHDLPKEIRLDNGSELRSGTFMGWSEERGIEL